jgi:hypothetical protein
LPQLRLKLEMFIRDIVEKAGGVNQCNMAVLALKDGFTDASGKQMYNV